jgi:SPP1 family predicted phage head-tail adaptor
MSNSNDLKHRVSVYKYDRSNNAAGTPIESFKFYKYTYAGIRSLSGDLQNDPAPGTTHNQVVEIVLRYDELIDYNCKIVYAKNTYRIDYIDPEARKGFLKLRCMTYNEIIDAGQ